MTELDKLIRSLLSRKAADKAHKASLPVQLSKPTRLIKAAH